MHHLTFTFILTKVVLHKAADIIMASMLDLYSSTMKRTPIVFFFFFFSLVTFSLRRNVFSITATLEGYIKLFCFVFQSWVGSLLAHQSSRWLLLFLSELCFNHYLDEVSKMCSCTGCLIQHCLSIDCVRWPVIVQ